MRLSTSIVALSCSLLIACGGASLARRGDKQLAGGQVDAAIASYDAAARASASDPVEAARFRAQASKARIQAAHQQIDRGDRAYGDRNLRAAGEAYKRARSYAPTEALVVDRLSTLLKTRVGIESRLDAAWKELDTLQRMAGKAPIERWQRLVTTTDQLLEWRQDYPRTKALWQAVATPASQVLLTAARQHLNKKDYDSARLSAEKALRLSPNDPTIKKLLDRIDRGGSASAHTAEGDQAMKQGRVDDALEAYHLALSQNPDAAEATVGQNKARDAYVKAHLSTARALRKRRDRRGELLTLRDAWTVNTDTPGLKKKLASAYDRAHKRAIQVFYRAGRKHESGKRFGAALIAYRTAATLGGGPKDLGSRIERCTKRSAEGQSLLLHVSLRRPAKGVLPAGAAAAMTSLRGAIADAKLADMGVHLTEDARTAKRAGGALVLSVDRFALPHGDRREARKKKYLDRVEFPPNPRWAEAQARQSAVLADLNGATDRARPLRQQVNTLEARLASLDEKLTELKARIRKEDAAYYARKPKPCPDGSANCPQSYAHRRWAKHLTWHRDQIAKTNAKIAKLSPAFSAAREAEAKAQAAFDAAERAARETPAKLRKEIWKTYAYTVQLHIVELQGTVQLRWRDTRVKAELAGGEAKVDDQKVDFSTPGVVVKQQTLEPPRKSSVPSDAVLTTDLANKLVKAVAAAVLPKLRLHGERFVLRARLEKRAPQRLDLQVRALATGKALSAESRKQVALAVLKATGYQWDSMTVDLKLIPYR